MASYPLVTEEGKGRGEIKEGNGSIRMSNGNTNNNPNSGWTFSIDLISSPHALLDVLYDYKLISNATSGIDAPAGILTCFHLIPFSFLICI